MSNPELRFRQIHLDFHTGEKIPGIASDFNAYDFAETLKEAGVNSITCFARGHHGMIYYDSEKFPERVHPHLENKNLLKEQIEACHERDINVPVYITVQWDYYTAREHPEWLALDEEGNPIGTPVFEPGFYRMLCVNTPYRDFLKEQTAEVMENFDVDGIFYDIVKVEECTCKYCQAGMKEQGLNPANAEDRKQYAQSMINDFKREMSQFVHKYNEDCTIFYNKGHVGPAHRPVKEAYTHFELESLPSGGWGYLHFPIAMRYARTLGLDCLGMTGKFHTSWGDFHSFKNEEALAFECFQMLALNAKCSIGDQLEPGGELSQPVYDLIGSVYKQVEAKEAWCEGAEAVTEIGVLTPEEFSGIDGLRLAPSLMGVTRMLQERGYQFDIIDSGTDFSAYKVLILPDNIPVDDDFAAKLEQYIDNGGRVAASYKSGLDPDNESFNLNNLGVKLKGEAPYSPDFIVPEKQLAQGLPETEHVMYLKGLEVEAEGDSEVLSMTNVPYFNRTWEHFCSHRHTPSAGKEGYPAVVQGEGTIYFMHPLFTQYNKNAPHWCKQLFLNALELLLPEQLVEHDGPSTLHVYLNQQQEKERQILHLLHYIPERRSQDIDIIEDVIPLYNINISLAAADNIKEVKLAPEGENLDFEQKEGRVIFELPELKGHQMVELKF